MAKMKSFYTKYRTCISTVAIDACMKGSEMLENRFTI